LDERNPDSPYRLRKAQKDHAMTSQSAARAKQENIAEMGEALGAQYAELWQDIAHLHLTWLEYVELF
jgi:predicted MarR family transcription regulator